MSFTGELCALCNRRPSTGHGEHVWPSWFLKFFPEGVGPYIREVNGQPERTRDVSNKVRQHKSMERVTMPCCADDNDALERRFEQPSMALIRRIFECDGRLVLESSESGVLGLWLLKTWLLLVHPRAVSSWRGKTHASWDLSKVPDDLYSWMVNGDPPPSGLSVWIARESPVRVRSVARRHIPLPTVNADGRTIKFQAVRCSVMWLDVSVVYHPGWEIDHPLELEGRAVRLRPTPSAEVNVGHLPEVGARDTGWIEGPTLTFEDGAYDTVELRPLGPTLDLLFRGVPGVVYAAAPPLSGR